MNVFTYSGEFYAALVSTTPLHHDWECIHVHLGQQWPGLRSWRLKAGVSGIIRSSREIHRCIVPKTIRDLGIILESFAEVDPRRPQSVVSVSPLLSGSLALYRAILAPLRTSEAEERGLRPITALWTDGRLLGGSQRFVRSV